MAEYYDEHGDIVTEAQLRAEFEQAENPDGLTFRQFVWNCMDHQGGTLGKVAENTTWRVEFSVNGLPLDVGEGWGLGRVEAERIVEDLEYQGVAAKIKVNFWDLTE